MEVGGNVKKERYGDFERKDRATQGDAFRA
jgi:hypothetical protein